MDWKKVDHDWRASVLINLKRGKQTNKQFKLKNSSEH